MFHTLLYLSANFVYNRVSINVCWLSPPQKKKKAQVGKVYSHTNCIVLWRKNNKDDTLSNLKRIWDALTCFSRSGLARWTLTITLWSRWVGSVTYILQMGKEITGGWITSLKSPRSHCRASLEVCLMLTNPLLLSTPMPQHPLSLFLGGWISCLCQNLTFASVFPFSFFPILRDFCFPHSIVWFHFQDVLHKKLHVLGHSQRPAKETQQE